MHANPLIVGLSVALFLAVGLLVFGVGRIVYGIAHYYLRERKPERQFRHPELGLFTSDDDLWMCEVRRDGRDIRIVVGGTESAPSEKLLAQGQEILGRFAEVEQRAIEFLRTREAEVLDGTLELYALDIIDEQRPDDFTFEFIDSRNGERAWRVEFVAGEPRHTGFDD
ncbi:hypothetical protein LBMAG56_31170 [Verrucomicrobiota bacterium]|nr:hypothetical protein LBMAG56_31170 [Verrucomicrobiota bacterium]